MSIFWITCVIILPVLGLGYFTVHKMRPGSFRVQTSVWRVFSFRLEIESTDITPKPTHEQRPKASEVPGLDA
jgi:hypothetical protein